MPSGEQAAGGTAEGRVNGGGGLGSTGVPTGTVSADCSWSAAPPRAAHAGSVLTLIESEREPDPTDRVGQLVGPDGSDRADQLDGPTMTLTVLSSPGRPIAAPPVSTPATTPAAGAGGPSGRQAAADHLTKLARCFARCSEEQAHDLFTDAFGLYGARHFGAGPDPVGADLAGVSWWHGPTVRQPAAAPPVSVLPRVHRGRGSAPAPGSAAADRARAGRHRKPEPPAGAAGATGAAEEVGAAERRAAARILLAHPLVTATGPHAQAFPLIQRHAQWLADRFRELLGYPLIVTPTFARLVKTGLGTGSLRRLSIDGIPCTPAHYAALALALAVLLTGPDRWSIGRLTARIAEAAEAALADLADLADLAAEPMTAAADGSPADPVSPVVASEAITAAVGLLTEWQVLSVDTRIDTGAGLAVDRDLAAVLATGCHLESPAEPPVPRTTVPVAVRRRLAETPVVLLDELTGLEREWLWESRRREAKTFADFLGLTAEIRSEGIALLDPADELTDLPLPGPEAPAYAALLLVERLVEQLRPLPAEADDPAPAGNDTDTDTDTGSRVPIAEALIDGILGDVADEYGEFSAGAGAGWRRDHLADRAAFRREVLDLLHRLGLIASAPALTPVGASGDPASPHRGGWLLLAPAARYAAELELRPATGTGRHSRRCQLG